MDNTQGYVVAGCRDPEGAGAKDLREFASRSGGRVWVKRVDVSCQTSVEAFGAEMAQSTDRCDLLINNAGVLHDKAFPLAPERALKQVDRTWFMKTLETNTIGPLMMVQALEPLLRTAGRGVVAGTRPPSVVANLSARVGSIGDNGLGGWYSYRISKAALNQATKTMALELRRSGIWVVSLHPGTTATGLSEPFQKNVKPEKLFTTEFTAQNLLGIIDDLNSERTGSFYAWDGQEIEW